MYQRLCIKLQTCIKSSKKYLNLNQIKAIRIKQLWDTCVRFKLKHERMHFTPFNLTKESGLSATEYITIQTNCAYDWHLTNLHSRASKGNKIMRKLQGKWVLVPHGELKLIICDNLSASENSNMSTKLHELQKGAGKNNDERKGEGKEKGAVRDIVCAWKESTPRLAERQRLTPMIWQAWFQCTVQYYICLLSLEMIRCNIWGSCNMDTYGTNDPKGEK